MQTMRMQMLDYSAHFARFLRPPEPSGQSIIDEIIAYGNRKNPNIIKPNVRCENDITNQLCIKMTLKYKINRFKNSIVYFKKMNRRVCNSSVAHPI